LFDKAAILPVGPYRLWLQLWLLGHPAGSAGNQLPPVKQPTRAVAATQFASKTPALIITAEATLALVCEAYEKSACFL
jgi:hypothetical protein